MQSKKADPNRPKNLTVFKAAKYIYDSNGMKGLYRGVTPRIGLGVWQTVCMVGIGDLYAPFTSCVKFGFNVSMDIELKKLLRNLPAKPLPESTESAGDFHFPPLACVPFLTGQILHRDSYYTLLLRDEYHVLNSVILELTPCDAFHCDDFFLSFLF